MSTIGPRMVRRRLTLVHGKPRHLVIQVAKHFYAPTPVLPVAFESQGLPLRTNLQM